MPARTFKSYYYYYFSWRIRALGRVWRDRLP
jgi:hypothetical protein